MKKRGVVRSTGDLQVNLTLRDHGTGNKLTDPLAGNLENVSVAGASLTVSHIRSGGYHLFYAAKDSLKPILYLESAVPEDDAAFFSLPVQPVWFNCEEADNDRSFKIGVEFMEDRDSEVVRNLIRNACGKNVQSGGWFNNMRCSMLNAIKAMFTKSQ